MKHICQSLKEQEQAGNSQTQQIDLFGTTKRRWSYSGMVKGFCCNVAGKVSAKISVIAHLLAAQMVSKCMQSIS